MFDVPHCIYIQMLWENKDDLDELPHLIYVSREKSFKHHHYYKAGAMNVLVIIQNTYTL